MKIKWYGHSAFRLTMTDGVSIIIDPYEPGGLGGVIRYDQIMDPADIVLISHDHTDHNYTEGIKGPFRVIRKEGSYNIKGVRVIPQSAFCNPQLKRPCCASPKFTLSCGRTGDAQRLLRIEEEAPLKDQKIALLEQPGPAFLNFRLQIKHSAIRIPHSAIVIRERPRSGNRNRIGSYKSRWD